MVKSEPKKKPQFGGFFQKFFRKPEKNQKEQRLTVQRSIPYLEMGRDGICRVEEHLYSKTVRFYDINYQLAQNEDKNTIFESWCDFLNYFDASIRFQLSFINHKSDMSEYNKVIQIEPQHDAFDDVRMEYAQMLRQQLAKGNNGLVRTKYITFSIEAKSVREAKPRLERIETDILNNFKVLGVKAYPLNGVERLQIMYEAFHQEEQQKFDFSYDRILQSGMTTKDFIAPTSFLFKSGKDFMMGGTYGAASYLNILAPELTDKVLAEFLDIWNWKKNWISRFGRWNPPIRAMEEALEAYDKIPSERMNADKCIGFCIEEDGGFVGMYELVVNDKVQRENINSINYFRDDKLVQQAIFDMEKLMAARQQSKEQERGSTKKSVLDALRSLKAKKQEQPAQEQDKPKKAKKKGMEL